jgi:L-asparagine transporter-like permease
LATILTAFWPAMAFGLMMSIAIFGAMFAWLMIFITHLFFRARYDGPALSFRMVLHPLGSLAGAGLMAAIMITTAFTNEFRMTLVYGLAFMIVLVTAYALRYRKRG